MLYLLYKGGKLMLQKNIDKLNRKSRNTWTPYYERVTKNKKAYNRKEKHKGKGWD